MWERERGAQFSRGEQPTAPLRGLSPDEVRRLSILSTISQLLNTPSDVNEVLQSVLNAIMTALGADQGVVMLRQGKSTEVVAAAARNARTTDGMTLHYSQTIVSGVLARGEPILSVDASEDESLSHISSLRIYGTRSVMCCPMMARGRSIGLIYLDDRASAGLFSPTDLELLGVICDMVASATERARVEADIRKREERFQMVARATQDVILEWNLETGSLWLSDAATVLFLYVPEEVGPDIQWWRDRIHPEDRDRILTEIRSVIESGGRFWSGQYRFCKADRDYAWLFHRGYIARDDAGRPLGMIGALMDITERTQMEEELRQAQKMEAVGLLAGGIAHDFNNTLTAVMGYSLLLMQNVEETSAMHADLSEIHKAAERAASLTRQLLHFSSRQIQQLESIDINTAVLGMERLLARLIGENIHIVTRLDPMLPHVKADLRHIEQVILNLAVNARDAMAAGGTLTLATQTVEMNEDHPLWDLVASPGIWALLSVDDTGEGMDAATLKHIFEPFFTTKEVGRGTGLGLSTVYGIVKQHQGHIRVHSEPGRGASFQIYLPGCETPARPGTTAPEATRPAAGGETVLVVEDDDLVRHLSCKVLERKGYRVLEAGHGLQAIDVCRQHAGPIHVMLTDVVMPHMGADELAAEVVKLRPDLKIIYTSGYYSESSKRPRGAFLQKPFTPDALDAKLREALDGHSPQD